MLGIGKGGRICGNSERNAFQSGMRPASKVGSSPNPSPTGAKTERPSTKPSQTGDQSTPYGVQAPIPVTNTSRADRCWTATTGCCYYHSRPCCSSSIAPASSRSLNHSGIPSISPQPRGRRRWRFRSTYWFPCVRGTLPAIPWSPAPTNWAWAWGWSSARSVASRGFAGVAFAHRCGPMGTRIFEQSDALARPFRGSRYRLTQVSQYLASTCATSLCGANRSNARQMIQWSARGSILHEYELRCVTVRRHSSSIIRCLNHPEVQTLQRSRERVGTGARRSTALPRPRGCGPDASIMKRVSPSTSPHSSESRSSGKPP